MESPHKDSKPVCMCVEKLITQKWQKKVSGQKNVLTPGVDEAGIDALTQVTSQSSFQEWLNEQTETSSGIFLRLFIPR